MAAFFVSASVESGSDPFAQQRALTPAFDPAFAHPSAARNVGWRGWVRLTGTVSGMGQAHAPGGLGRTPNPGLAACAGLRTLASRCQAPMGEGALLAKHCFASARTHSRQRLGRTAERGLRRVPGSLTHPGPTANQQSAGNALNLTAPRKYPPRPCRCRCTWSPCRTSAGDDAGRAAGLRYGSRRLHPAGGPGQSRRPAG